MTLLFPDYKRAEQRGVQNFVFANMPLLKCIFTSTNKISVFYSAKSVSDGEWLFP